MKKPRLLISHPRLRPCGGGNLVGAWVIQALADDCDISVATMEPVDVEALNLHFGTSLAPSNFEVHVAPNRYNYLVDYLPTPGALLENCLTMRWAQELDRRYHFDILFSTANEADFHRRGMQYVHFPWLYLPRPEQELRAYHRIPGLLSIYRAGCIAIGRATPEGLARNRTFANSRYVGGLIKQMYETDPQVLYPPVPGNFSDVAWNQRRLAAAAVGRIHRGKRWDMAVEIVDSVRRRGHNLELTLIGHSEGPDFLAQLKSMAASRPWFRILENVGREQLLAEMSHHRYGIHPMLEEHFGIAPAELQRSGCLAFVHNSGGQVEIVGHDQRLLFQDVDDGARKMISVIENQSLERELRTAAATRRAWFSERVFCNAVREAVAAFSGSQVGAVCVA